MRIVAAGVIVVEGDQILAFARSDKPGYALPCGHVEEGEEPGAAALREALEETGLVLALDEATPPFVAFDPRGGKQVATYLARVVGGALRETDLDEGRPCWTRVADVVDGPYGDYNRRALAHFRIAY